MNLTADIPLLLFYAANSCYALAYMLRNIFALRLMSITAALLTFPYFIFQSEILYSALLWQSVFAGVNIINIVRLAYERRPVKLTKRQQHFKEFVFPQFSNREMLTLLRHATPHMAIHGQTLIDADSNIRSLYLLCSGRVAVVQNGQLLTCRHPGVFLGEAHYMTGERTTASVVFAEQGSYLRWDSKELKDLLERNEGLRQVFNSMLTQHVTRKLRCEEL